MTQLPTECDFYKDLIDNLHDGIYFVDRDRVINYWNQGAERITGYKKDQVIGRACRDNILNHVNAEGDQLCLNGCPLHACMEDGKEHEQYIFLHHADGHRIPVLVRTSPIRNAHGEIIGAVETFSEAQGVASLNQQIKELRYTAQTDSLTGLKNRSYLERKLHSAALEYENRISEVGVLFIDIDHFKKVNDTYGHEVGDKVLRMVASTLHHNMRHDDIVGRWGGDEFLAILFNVASKDNLRLLSDKLRNLVESSYLELPDEILQVTISVGAALYLPNDTPKTIVQRADELMYQNKREGRNRVSL